MMYCWWSRADCCSRVINDSGVLMKYCTQSRFLQAGARWVWIGVVKWYCSVVNEHEDNGKCRYWPAAGFCDRAMSEIVCQLWPQLVSHLALQKEKREKGNEQSKFFKNCLFAGEEGSGRSSWQKGDECGGSRARHSSAHGLVTSRHCGWRPGEPRDLERLNLTTEEARRAITSAAEVTTVEC